MKKELIKRIISSIILTPAVLFFIIKGGIFFNIFLLMCFFITIYEWNIMTKKKKYNLVGIFFLIFSFYTFYKLRNYSNENYLYILLITTICVATDLGGFIFGKLIKGPKLTKLSPQKTYAGMFGGFFLSVISIYFFLKNPYLEKLDNIASEVLILLLLVSAISQLGDIIISYFKRKSNIKDTGFIIPGHGGLLDRIDGMIFAFPFSYIILSVNKIIIF